MGVITGACDLRVACAWRARGVCVCVFFAVACANVARWMCVRCMWECILARVSVIGVVGVGCVCAYACYLQVKIH